MYRGGDSSEGSSGVFLIDEGRGVRVHRLLEDASRGVLPTCEGLCWIGSGTLPRSGR